MDARVANNMVRGMGLASRKGDPSWLLIDKHLALRELPGPPGVTRPFNSGLMVMQATLIVNCCK